MRVKDLVECVVKIPGLFSELKAPKSRENGWLGGLDSNQDNQIQSLMYCQLYDLPVVKNMQAVSLFEATVCGPAARTWVTLLD